MKTSLGRKKKLGHLSEVFYGKGFRGHVVCNVMFAYLPLRVRETLTVDGPPTPTPPPNLQPCSVSAFHSPAHSPGHASQQPTPQLRPQPIKEPQRNPHTHLTPSLSEMPLFIPCRPLKEGAGLSLLPHWLLSHHFSKQALTRIKEYHH